MRTGKHTESFIVTIRMAWVVLAIGCGGSVSLGSQEEEGGVPGSGGATSGLSTGTDGVDRDAAVDAPVSTGGAAGQGGSDTGKGQAGSGGKGGTGGPGASASGGGVAGGSSASGTAGAGGTAATGGTTGTPITTAVSVDAGVASDGTAGTGGTGGAGGTGGSGGAKDAGAQPTDAQPGSCRALTTEAACQTRTDCHAVFIDSDCECPTPGCCAKFSMCADGGHANCSGPNLCPMATPNCVGPYTVSYANGCYEGCVRSASCAPDAGTTTGS